VCSQFWLDSFGEEVEGVAVLFVAGFDDCREGFDEAAGLVALGAEGEFAAATTKTPCPGVAQRLVGSVVGRFDSGDVGERPELVDVVEQAVAQRL
jgi:hypothetical protein